MKKLLLIRHAKSNWDTPLKDIDRPLDQRGINDAHLVSLNISNFIPKTYVIHCSTAKRTTATALIFAQNLHYPIESIIYKPELYTFDESQLEKTIKSTDNSIESIILFGHNAAITNFVNKFGDVFITNVPTTGFVSLAFEVNNWNNIKDGKTIKIVTPKDLK